jgi:hypothetical protein
LRKDHVFFDPSQDNLEKGCQGPILKKISLEKELDFICNSCILKKIAIVLEKELAWSSCLLSSSMDIPLKKEILEKGRF